MTEFDFDPDDEELEEEPELEDDFVDYTSEIHGEPEEHDDGGEPYGDLTPQEWYEKHWPSNKLYDYKHIEWGK